MPEKQFKLDESVRDLTESISIDKSACEKLVADLPDEIMITENYVSFDIQESNVQIILKDSARDSSRDLKLYRLVKSISGRDPSFKLDESAAVNGLGYDLILRKRKDINFENVEEPEFQAKLYCSYVPKITYVPKRQFAEALVDFVGIPAYVNITGSYIYHKPDRKPNDIDVVIKCDGAQPELIESLSEIVKEKTGLDPHFVWEARGPNWTFMPVYDLVYRVRNREQDMTEAFHIRDTHWLPVPESGQCPATHPNKLPFPGAGTIRCFSDSAATEVRRLNEQNEPPTNKRGFTVQKTFEERQKLDRKFTKPEANFKEKSDDPKTVCGNCRFYLRHPRSTAGECQVVDGEIPWFSTSDLFISAEAEAIASFNSAR